MRLAYPRRLKLRAERGDQHHRRPRNMLYCQIEQLTGGWIGPMQILEYHQDRLTTCQTGEVSQQRREGLLFLSQCGQVERGITMVERQRQKLRQQWHVTFRGRVRRK